MKFESYSISKLVLLLIAICNIANLHSSVLASSSTLGNHDSYCDCGPKCRKDKCCCAPEPEADINSIDLTNESESQGRVYDGPSIAIKRLYCQISSQCKGSPESPDYSLYKVVVNEASLSFVKIELPRYSVALQLNSLPPYYLSEYLNQIIRPPEVLFG